MNDLRWRGSHVARSEHCQRGFSTDKIGRQRKKKNTVNKIFFFLHRELSLYLGAQVVAVVAAAAAATVAQQIVIITRSCRSRPFRNHHISRKSRPHRGARWYETSSPREGNAR